MEKTQLVESEKQNCLCSLWHAEQAPFFQLFFSPFLSLVIVTQGAVLLNNSFHINILLPAYLLCYAGAKHWY